MENYQNQYPSPPTYLTWAIISTILCCWPLGIVGIVYANKVSTSLRFNELELATYYSKKARNWTIASAICGLLWSVFCLFLFFIQELGHFFNFLIFQ